MSSGSDKKPSKSPAQTKGNEPVGQQMWGGRFAAKPDAAMQAINASINVDKRMWREDIEGSIAHATMLASSGVISRADSEKIQGGLREIAQEIEAETFEFTSELEDIHLNIEARLSERIGDAGRRLHTARSRNDQVATDFKLWTARACDAAGDMVVALQLVLVERADETADWIMPGFTHLQTAQPITLGHHLLAYVEMLERDMMRLAAAASMAREACPLGSAALAGTSFPIDRAMTARALGFEAPSANSLDGVSSRDFALQALSALSIAAMHLSRLAEELILWTSPQFRFARLSDAWSTGSSIMPQKRNPDAAELIRAKASRIAANLGALLSIMNALPLTYAKDMQEDKDLTFGAFDAFELCVVAMSGMMQSVRFDRPAMEEAADQGFSTATDLADWLVQALQMPFRDAHHVAGSAVKAAEERGLTTLAALPLAVFQEIEPRITAEATSLLTVKRAVETRQSYGGTAPINVRQQIARWRAQLQTNEETDT
jgi:argininosuccinate lyase